MAEINVEITNAGPQINVSVEGSGPTGAPGKSPIIRDGNWWQYDDRINDYSDTGVIATGKQGEPGPQGPAGQDGAQGPAGTTIYPTELRTTIPSTGWEYDSAPETYTATISIPGLSADAVVFVDVDLSIAHDAAGRAEALSAWNSGPGAGYSVNSAGSIFFVVDTAPTIDIPIKVVYFDAGIS